MASRRRDGVDVIARASRDGAAAMACPRGRRAFVGGRRVLYAIVII